jgi:hypothetical protein
MAVVTDLAGYVGEDWLPTFTATVPTPITGWTIAWTLRNPFTGAVLATRSGADVTITDATRGVFTVRIYAADLTRAPGRYDWDVSRTDPGANTVLARGKFQLDAR